MLKSLLSVAALALAARLVSAHYTFPALIANGATSTDWQYVRLTANHYSNGPVTSVTDTALRCYELDSTVAGTTSTATVTAGSTVGFRASNVMGHPGYFSAYMSAASPAANSPTAATGATWFKIWEWAPTYSKSTGLVFASVNLQEVSFTIPKALPSGQYLLRIEQIALHIAGAPQFYIGCAQLNVANGGSGSPSPKVAIPGVYTGSEPGLTVNQYALPADYTGYTSPGPAVWTG